MLTGNRSRSLSTISTGIHAMPNTHNGYTGNLITSKNGTLNGCRTTPTRQQRGMNIHNAKRRHMQNFIRQNATVRSHTENISLSSLERLNNLRRHTISLNNRQPQLKRLGLNRRRLKLLTTPTNSIRTSDDKRNLIPNLNKQSQRRHSKIRRTHKHDTHIDRLPSTKAETATNYSARPSPNQDARSIQHVQIYPKTKKGPHQKQPSQQSNYQRRRPSLAHGTRERRARKRSPLPPQGLGYCSTRSSARAEEHLMCSSCEQDCLSMEQNLSPAAEGDGQSTPSRPVERRGPGRLGTP